jgi:hypothetical protein
LLAELKAIEEDAAKLEASPWAVDAVITMPAPAESAESAEPAEPVDPAHEALRVELTALKPSGLRKRAAAAGVDPDALDEAEDSDEPKEAIIALICQAELHPTQKAAVPSGYGSDHDSDTESEGEASPGPIVPITEADYSVDYNVDYNPTEPAAAESSGSYDAAETAETPGVLQLSLNKGRGGFGMEINPHGYVVVCTPGGVADTAGVPVPCRIVSVHGIEVASKVDVVAALGHGRAGQPVPFAFDVTATEAEVTSKRDARRAKAAQPKTPDRPEEREVLDTSSPEAIAELERAIAEANEEASDEETLAPAGVLQPVLEEEADEAVSPGSLQRTEEEELAVIGARSPFCTHAPPKKKSYHAFLPIHHICGITSVGFVDMVPPDPIHGVMTEAAGLAAPLAFWQQTL